MNVIDSILRGQINENTLLNRLDFRNNWWKGFIAATTFYEMGTGNELKRTFSFVEVLAGCGLSVEEKEFQKDGILIYPNPCVSNATVRFVAQNERVHIEIYDLNGRSVAVVTDQLFDQGTHNVTCDLHDLKAGRYQIRVVKPSGILTKPLVKL